MLVSTTTRSWIVFVVCSDARAERLWQVEQYRPISWDPKTVCEPSGAGRALTEKERGILEDLRGCLNKLDLMQHVTEDGWYHVEYTDF